MQYKLVDEKVNTKKGIALISGEFLKYKRRLLAIIFCLLVSTVASVMMPQLLKYAIDEAIVTPDLSKLWFIAGYFVLLLLLISVVLVIQSRLTGFVAQKVLFELRKKVFLKLQEMPMAFFSENQSGDIIQRLTGNVEALNSFFSEGFIRLINITFAIIGYLIAMLAMNALLGSIVLVAMVLAIIYLLIQGRILNRLVKKTLDNEGVLASQLQETLNGFQVVKIYEKENEFKELFQTKNNIYFKSVLKSNIVASLSDGVLPFIFSIATISVVLISLNMFAVGSMTQGAILAYLTYLVSFFRRFDGISALWNTIQNGLASAARINELLKIESDIKTPADAFSPKKNEVKGDIEFKNVSFNYDDESDVLKNIDLKVTAGETIAVIGPTGGGKTSFVNLIARLYDVKSGELFVDEKNVKEWDLNILRESMGYLIQDAIFFSGPILDNLKYDNPSVTEEKVIEVLKNMGADNLIPTINSETKDLSAGQKQILALVRLILRDPKILILDEATSNIDTMSEKAIQQAIEIVRQNKTTFIIAHRLSTIFNADKIILIQNNSIAESGTHEELLSKKGIYYNIYAKFIGK